MLTKNMIKDMLDEPVSKYTFHKILAVDCNFKVSDAAKLLTEEKRDSLLVSEANDLIGIITIKDMISDVVAKGKDPSKVIVNEIVHKPLIEIHKDSPVREAIALMNKHDIRRLVVTNDEREIGIITQKTIVGDMGKFAAVLPELAIPEKISCPYCPSVFENKNVLSRHIDDIHIGRGLLEGNLVKA